MKKPPKTPQVELYPCKVCGESLPFESFPVVEDRRADYCKECRPPAGANDVEAQATKKYTDQMLKIIATARERTPCKYCGKVRHIDGWFKVDGEPVDLHGHVHIRRLKKETIENILKATTALCPNCAEIRMSHPKHLHKELERLFCDVLAAGKAKNENYRRRLYLQYKALQHKVKKADEEWREKLED